MINVSDEFKTSIQNDNKKYIIEIEMALNNGKKIKINNSDIWDSGLSFEESTSNSGSFDIGAVVISKCKIVLNNIYDKFSEYDFFNATLILYIGLQLKTTKEMIRKGFYTVSETSYNGSIITLDCLDNMWKFDRPYSEVKTAYPATTGVIIADICLQCGVSLGKANFDNYNFSIAKRPEDEMNCREVISYVAQICGCYAKINNTGALIIDWYKKHQIALDADGGYFDQKNFLYESGDSLDGGNFLDYNSGDDYDGGSFEDWKKIHSLFSNNSTKLCTDDILITGIKVLSEKENGYSFLHGKEGYLLSIKNNPFIDEANGQKICTFVGNKIGQMSFRPFEASSLNDVTVEAGDSCVIRDFKGNTYYSYITNLSFKIGNFESFSCGAEMPIRKNIVRYSSLAKTEVEIKRESEEKLSNYDKAVQNMNQLAGNAMGFHTTYDELSDGSRITYMHDKPKLSDSQIVYKQSIDGFFISRDGGKTYTMGFDSNGNVVLNILYAIGIVCDWIRGGTLTLGGDNNTNGIIKMIDSVGNMFGMWDNNNFLIKSKNYQPESYGKTQTFPVFDYVINGVTTKQSNFYLNSGEYAIIIFEKSAQTSFTLKYYPYNSSAISQKLYNFNSNTLRIDLTGIFTTPYFESISSSNNGIKNIYIYKSNGEIKNARYFPPVQNSFGSILNFSENNLTINSCNISDYFYVKGKKIGTQELLATLKKGQKSKVIIESFSKYSSLYFILRKKEKYSQYATPLGSVPCSEIDISSPYFQGEKIGWYNFDFAKIGVFISITCTYYYSSEEFSFDFINNINDNDLYYLNIYGII